MNKRVVTAIQTHRGHGDDGPPEAFGNGLEVVARVGLQALSVVHERGEDDDTEHEEEDEQEEFFGARLEGVHQDLESSRMSGQLEKPQDSDY